MADNADTLSIKLTMEAKEATESVDKLTKSLRSLAQALKQVQERSGLSGLNESVKKATESVSTAMKGVDSGAKTAEKGTKAVATAAKEATKATKELKQVAEKVKVNVDTSGVKQAQNDMAIARQKFAKPVEAKAEEARKALPENLHETASKASPNRQTWADTMSDLPKSMGETAEAIESYEESMAKYAENIRKLKGEVAKATESAPQTTKGNPPGWENMSAEEKRDAWINMGATGKKSNTYQTRTEQRRAEYKENWAQYLAENQTTESSLDDFHSSAEKIKASTAGLKEEMQAFREFADTTKMSAEQKSKFRAISRNEDRFAEAKANGDLAQFGWKGMQGAKSSLDTTAESTNKATSAFSELKTAASSALEAISGKAKLASVAMNTSFESAKEASGKITSLKSTTGFFEGLGTRIRNLPWRIATNGANLFGGAMRKLGGLVRGANGVFQGFAGQILRIPFKALKGVLNVATFGMIGRSAKAGQSAFSGLTNAVGTSLTGIMRYALGFRTLFYLVRALRGAIAEGFTNLASVNAETNESLSMLKSRLTQVKNGLASAFAPVLNYVAPILNVLIGKLMDGINAVAQFFATLTGKTSWQKAVYKAQDFSAAASGAGDAASGANEKAKELQKTLLSFDKINKLNDADSSSGSGGSGGGSGGGGGAAGAGMFSTETVSTGISDFANMVKNAWQNADFTEVGRVVGEKLGTALESIPWGKIQTASKKIGASTATFINGFVESEIGKDEHKKSLGTVVGNTIGEAINTGILGVEEFAKKLHWDSVGKFIADSFNGFFKTTKWADLGLTVSLVIGGILDLITTTLEETEWHDAGEAIGTFLGNIQWASILLKAGHLIAAIPGAVFGFVAGVFSGLGTEITKWFDGKKEEYGGTISGAFKGIFKEACKGITEQVLEPLFKPILDELSRLINNLPEKVKEKIGVNGNVDLWGGVSGAFKVTFDADETISYKNAVKKYDETKNKNVTASMQGNEKAATWVNLKKNFAHVAKGAVATVGTAVSDPKGAFKAFMDRFNGLSKKASKNKRKATLNVSLTGPASAIRSTLDAIRRAPTSKRSTITLTLDAPRKAREAVSRYEAAMKNPTPENLKRVMDALRADGGAFYGGKWHGIPQFAAGGYPSKGTMFIAGEAGAEAVSHINGRTEVLNQSQMASVMYSAVLRGMTQALANTQGTNPTFVITPDPKGIFRVVQTEANRYTASTGKPAFNI